MTECKRFCSQVPVFKDMLTSQRNPSSTTGSDDKVHCSHTDMSSDFLHWQTLRPTEELPNTRWVPTRFSHWPPFKTHQKHVTLLLMASMCHINNPLIHNIRKPMCEVQSLLSLKSKNENLRGVSRPTMTIVAESTKAPKQITMKAEWGQEREF